MIAKDKNIRKLVHSFQINCAYRPPKKFNGSCLDGRDITYKIVPDADFKFFITASLKIRAERRFRELKNLKPIESGDSELKNAMKMIAKTNNGPNEQFPSMGCSIKWF